MKYIETTDLSLIKDILKNTKITNKRFKSIQFEKYMSSNLNATWLIAYSDENKAKAMLIFFKDYCNINKTYIAEIQSFESGHHYGENLLNEMIKRHPDSWFFSENDNENLLVFYRNTNKFKEHCFTYIPKDKRFSIKNRVTKHMFCHKDIPYDEMQTIANALLMN